MQMHVEIEHCVVQLMIEIQKAYWHGWCVVYLDYADLDLRHMA